MWRKFNLNLIYDFIWLIMQGVRKKKSKIKLSIKNRKESSWHHDFLIAGQLGAVWLRGSATDQTSWSAIEQLPLALAQTKNDPQAKAFDL